MEFPFTIEFTRGEWAVIVDRLEAPDAIGQALTDGMFDEAKAEELRPLYTQRAYSMALYGIHRPTVTIQDVMDWEVLLDAIEGSTMGPKAADAIEYGEEADRKWGKSAQRAMRKVEKRFAAMGSNVKFPRW